MLIQGKIIPLQLTMIKVLYYKDHFRKHGGIERIWINKMNYLSEDSNYKIYTITNTQENKPFVYPLSSKVNHVDLNICIHHAYRYPIIFRPFIKAYKRILFYFRLQNAINTIQPNFIIIDSTYDPMIFRMKHHAKIIAESHTAKSFIHLEKKDFQRMFYHYENKADIVVSLTNGDAKEWTNAKRVEIIPNFIQKQNIPQMPKNVYNRAISAGRLYNQKKQEDLIKAWKKVAAEHPDWKLDIYGRGDRLQELQALIQMSGLQNCVHILPPTDHFTEELRRCDFFILSSLYEGFSLVIAEAMMAGTPCVSYDCPYGPSDLIDDKHNGLLVPAGNIDKLSEAINWMIKHPERRGQIGMQAYHDIQKYTPEFIIPKWHSLFENNK